jgi:hypothetical protein
MRLVNSCGAVLALATIAFFANPVQGARPEPQAGTLKGTPQRVVVGRQLQSAPPTCVLGVPGPASFPMFYLYPPEDQYYTLLDPGTCDCPEEESVQLATAHVQLDFPEACTIPVTVAVVAADLTDPSCPIPMPGQYLAPPLDYDLEVSEAGQYDFSLALPAGTCIPEKAFLLITFVTGGDCGSWPGLMIDTAVCGCVAYNAWPESGDPADLCGTLPGSPVMYVDATCCSVVPTTGHSWGGLKTIYR